MFMELIEFYCVPCRHCAVLWGWREMERSLILKGALDLVEEKDMGSNHANGRQIGSRMEELKKMYVDLTCVAQW